MALRARSDRSDPSAPEPPAARLNTPEDADTTRADNRAWSTSNRAMTWASTDRQASGRIEQRRRLPDLRVAALTPPVIAIRWGALAVGFALASADVADGDVRVLVFGGIILAYAVFRTLRPIRYEDGPGTVWGVLAELALCVVVVCATGYWESPFVFSLMTAVIAAGFARGFTFAINSALGSAAAVAIPYMLGASEATKPSEVGPVGLPPASRGDGGRLRPTHLHRVRASAVAGPRPTRTARRGQRAARVPPPSRSVPAGVARPRRRPRLDDDPPPRPDGVRLGGAAGPGRDRRDLGGRSPRRPEGAQPRAHAPAATPAAASHDRDTAP